MRLSSTKGAKVWPITKIAFLYGFSTSPIYWYRSSLTELIFSECVRVRPNIAVLEQIYSGDFTDGNDASKGLYCVCINAIKVEFRYRQSENYRSSFSPKSDSHEQRRELGFCGYCFLIWSTGHNERTKVHLTQNQKKKKKPVRRHIGSLCFV